MDKQGATDFLISVMNDIMLPHDVRAGAASGLGNIGSNEVRDALAKTIRNVNAPQLVRVAAAESLGRAAG